MSYDVKRGLELVAEAIERHGRDMIAAAQIESEGRIRAAQIAAEAAKEKS